MMEQGSEGLVSSLAQCLTEGSASSSSQQQQPQLEALQPLLLLLPRLPAYQHRGWGRWWWSGDRITLGHLTYAPVYEQAANRFVFIMRLYGSNSNYRGPWC
ncbi:unnamed protein product [Pleuronectes platessa]|uniref:Uncharacterized protein n=1 Tax=Pleuronectes platessa TaxID=8262 RepID=A0A9N7UA07_PLEPL|nr:unnamed protein product [Pleuronectes platessa]